MMYQIKKLDLSQNTVLKIIISNNVRLLITIIPIIRRSRETILCSKTSNYTESTAKNNLIIKNSSSSTGLIAS